VALTKSVAEVAPIIWGKYPPESVSALSIVAGPISPGDRHRQSSSSEHDLGP
jgi:hypothetical protein